MATAVLPGDELHTNTDDNHIEIFCLIWLDASINETRDTEQKLRSIINHLKKFQDVQQCQQYIEQRSQKDRLVLIVSGQLGQEIVPYIHKHRQVTSIYVYCKDKQINEQWTCNYTKVKAVVFESEELVSRITADHKIQKAVDEPLSINFFTTRGGDGKSTTGVNGQFVFSQVLIDHLLMLQYNETDKNELITRCKNEYEGNNTELNHLLEFQRDYSPDKVLSWYTRESFFYKILNAALRTQNIHMIFLFRAFIFDIHRQLQDYKAHGPLQVYRSQRMSSDELDELKKYIGQLISVNSFFSTSAIRETAIFLLGDLTAPIDLERVLFQIDADPKMVTTKPFADIRQVSEFSNESEVLFMLGSIFRLESIVRDNNIWIIQMTLCNDDEHDLKPVFMKMSERIRSKETNLRTLGKLLWEMGRLDLAEQYFQRLLQQLSSNDPLRGNLYEDLGQLESQRSNFDKSIYWYNELLQFQKQPVPPLRAPAIDIHPNAEWQQNGITVAGENGRGNGFNQLSLPRGLYVDDDQTVYVADTSNHRILEWQSGATSGQVVAGGNGKGSKAHQLNWPTDVIVDKERDSLIISDFVNERVVQWPRRNGTSGETIVSNIGCKGLTMNENGSLYVAEEVKYDVRRYPRGKSQGTVVAGGNGSGDHLNQLSWPGYVFVDRDHSVYVSDFHNHRVMKWMEGAKQGIVVAGDQGQGNGPKQLSGPAGIVVDQLGTVYVADQENHRIMRWPRGATEGSVIIGGNGGGGESNQLDRPIGLSFDRHGNLYVVDGGNDRVQKFNIASNA